MTTFDGEDKNHDPKCIRCAFIRAIKDKFPKWPLEDEEQGDKEIMECLISFTGFMLSCMDEEMQMEYLKQVGRAIAKFEHMTNKIEARKHLH